MKPHHILALLTAAMLYSCSVQEECRSSLTDEIEAFVADKDANIGIAIIIDGKDTISINGDRQYPMLSVYKLPIAIALADRLTASSVACIDPIPISNDQLRPDTYSPMRDRYPDADTLMMPLDSLLAYSLAMSDNNASDILLDLAGGPQAVMQTLTHSGLSKGIQIANTEHEMHLDPTLCYANSASPQAMAALLDHINIRCNGSLFDRIKHHMSTCTTGTSRIAKALAGTDATIGHKTGTGFTLPDGRLMAINDAAYINLPDGHRYSIAVFIENSAYDISTTEAIIAKISEIALTHIQKRHSTQNSNNQASTKI